jgi:heme/copper-type cytochrome/quinol oxidase subunit 1
MTMQETRPAGEAEAGTTTETVTEPAPPTPRRTANPLSEWVMTGDASRIGRLYIVFSLLFAVALLVVGALLGFERIDDTGMQILHADAVDQLYSFYGVGLVFAVALPLMLGLAIAIVPLQIGARGIAFPRAAALSFWSWLAGAGIMVGAYLANGGAGGGNAIAVELFLVALGLTATALLLASVCVATTVLTLRAAGMRLDRVPWFSWSTLVSASILLVSLPVLVGELVYLYLDHRYSQVVFGGDPGIIRHLGWALAAPELFAFAVPVLGFAADAGATFARERLQKPDVALFAIGLAGVLGFGAWLQPALYPTAPHSLLAKIFAIGAVLPPLIVLGVVALTLKAGRPSPGSPLLWGVGALLLYLGAAAIGVLFPFQGLELEGTVYAFAQFNGLMLATLLAGLGGLLYWGPKLWGRRPGDGLPRLLAVLGLLAVALVAIPDVILGFMKQPANSVSNFDIDGPFPFLNGLSAIGYCLIAIVVLGVIALALQGFTRGATAGDDPWDGQTLEWATTSPPPEHNFVEPPVVTSGEPLLDRKLAGSAAP